MAIKEKYSVKQQIADAFMVLMAQKAYIDITVTDVIQSAKVARVSFYRNFKSTADVVSYIAEKLAEEMTDYVLSTLVSNDERKWREFLLGYLYRFKRYQEKAKTVRCENISIIFSCLSRKMQTKEHERLTETLRDKYAAFGKIGLINNIVVKWMGEGMKETTEEMVDYIMSFITLF